MEKKLHHYSIKVNNHFENTECPFFLSYIFCTPDKKIRSISHKIMFFTINIALYVYPSHEAYPASGTLVQAFKHKNDNHCCFLQCHSKSANSQ